ncbi:uncharacterized protein LOC109721355 [Ananas comosus]|uniref:Uncharacterized protein LOC109721355 n=1 Tax=Ananas comosus TaxID=4615 RepID=A0A6P5G7D9_ANACO|nr:uncharacterized protein LOC109721355 [Ananas comosus]XP_020104511.1 uncharacterized protein LOC109721355 [Ananas comosus]
MAFHVACPITCRRVCYCDLGFPAELRSGRARGEFWAEIEELEGFLREPWTVRIGAGDGGGGATVQVLVPKAAAPEAAAAEDYFRRLEARGSAQLQGEAASRSARDDQEDQGFSGLKVMCCLCFSGDDEGSDRAAKMLSCNTCNKKYHKSCLKSWAEHRDLFHWSSWACPSCRICEVCRRTGDPNKLMFCKRCDGAYHCYCQQPPHKNISRGPYLCPKHTKCHSCGSNVPGSGPSTRWFLGYTCCDACGRLFVKGNYCPVCLKVYRDSEQIPMVCCDNCERWVHCECDGISEEKYQQYQADQNLQYRCAACRGDCYQVTDTEDAIRELWKRRDIADHDLIMSLRVAAGLPPEDEFYSGSPFSDDGQGGPLILKNETGKTLKFSVKGISDKSSNNFMEYGNGINRNSASTKRHTKRKGYMTQLVGEQEEIYLERRHEARLLGSNLRDQRIDDRELDRNAKSDVISFSGNRSSNRKDVKPSYDPLGGKNVGIVEDKVNPASTVPKVKIKGAKLPSLKIKGYSTNNVSNSETGRGTKLVIHIGSRNKNVSGSPRSETSSCQRDQEFPVSYGSENITQQRTKDGENFISEDCNASVEAVHSKGAKYDNLNQIRNSKHGMRENNDAKLRKVFDIRQKDNNFTGAVATQRSPFQTGRSNKIDPTSQNVGNEVVGKKESAGAVNSNDARPSRFVSNSSNDPKPLLRLKFKNPYLDNRSSWAREGEEDNFVKGHRSKRKRPSTKKVGSLEDSPAKPHQESPADEVMDANWILRKLGKDAIGKRVEVRLSSDNSWHQGVVSDIIEGTSSLSVRLNDGRCETLELGKEGIRFISQRHKRAKT